MSNVIEFPVRVADNVVCEFFVRGKPEPAGSKTNMPRKKFPWVVSNMKQLAALYPIVDANKNAAGWKKTVAGVAAYEYLEQPLDEPVALELVFVVSRPVAHWLRDGQLSTAGRRQSRPISPPDALKLARAVEDALTGIVYVDDSRIVYGSQFKRYQRTRDEPIGVHIRVRRLL